MKDYYSQIKKIAETHGFPKYLKTSEVIKILEELDYPLLEKEIKFRRDVIEINGKNFGPELAMGRVKGYGNAYVVSRKTLAKYFSHLMDLSIRVDYVDVKRIVRAYNDVLQRSRKYGMRGQRNFTGKVEDEIKGKLVELGFEKYAKTHANIDFAIDFELIDEKIAKRDKGDFVQIQTKEGEIVNLPGELTFSIKSTAGYFLAVPENELEWEGNYFVLAKLHINEDFLYNAIRAGFDLSEINYKKNLGWLEIRGFVSKNDFKDKGKSLYLDNLPGSYSLRRPFRKTNYIRTPSMLNQSKEDLISIFKQINSYIETKTNKSSN